MPSPAEDAVAAIFHGHRSAAKRARAEHKYGIAQVRDAYFKRVQQEIDEPARLEAAAARDAWERGQE